VNGTLLLVTVDKAYVPAEFIGFIFIEVVLGKRTAPLYAAVPASINIAVPITFGEDELAVTGGVTVIAPVIAEPAPSVKVPRT
jgi:hypothetical protein